MSNKIRKNPQQGFTVSEIIIVAPIVLAVLTGLVSSIMFITTSVLQLGKANYHRQEILSALTFIAEDLSVNSKILDESLIPLSPQGKDGMNAKFVADTHTLIIRRPLISSYPRDKDKDLVWVNPTGTSCSDSLELSNINVVYFLQDNTLWRRVLLPSGWQEKIYCVAGEETTVPKLGDRPSCSIANGNNCLAKDSKVLTEVTDFKVNTIDEKLVKVTLETKDQAITKKVFVDYPAHP